MREVADESRRRATVGGPASCTNSGAGSGVVAEDAARGGSRLSAAVAGVASCTPNRGAHTQHCPRVFRARKNSKFCAHTCPEGGDASKPGPTCDATELLGSRAKERAVQK